MDYIAQMRNMPQKNDFFIGFDSDGCVFDTMEIKHKECFCPNFIKHFNLQAASKYAREVWDFVNLYSKTRGCNRFLAIKRSIELISEWEVFQARGITPPCIVELNKWLEVETKLGNPALEAIVAETGNEELATLLAWSQAVNASVADMVHGIPPFPGVREVIDMARDRADMIVVSQTPLEALEREWQEHGIDQNIELICGQEHGTKAEHLEYSAVGKYELSKIMMIGDAPGDLKAAQANNVLFFPILPGSEEYSWALLRDEGLDRFFTGRFAGKFQNELLSEFEESLPEAPPWQ